MAQKEFNVYLVELVKSLEYDFSGMIRSMLERNPDHFFISMPQILLKMFVSGVAEKYGKNNTLIISTESELKFAGVKVIPSHEMKISFFHRDYPLKEDPKLIRQVVISQPADLKGFSFYGITINKDHYKLENPKPELA